MKKAVLLVLLVLVGAVATLVFVLPAQAVDFDAGPDQVVHVGDTVQFSGTIYPSFRYPIESAPYWLFGDNTPAGNGLTPTHIYTSPGTYIVTLNIMDVSRSWGSDSLTVTVLPNLAIPEYFLGTITPLVACFMVFGVLRFSRRAHALRP
jgi:hypothetical protein